MLFDSTPTWAIFLATIGLVLLSLQIGVLLGRSRRLRGETKLEASGAMVGTTMGLLAFMLAFTFNSASGHHDARKALVVDEANAIETTWLRAGFLAEPYRSDIRGWLQDYVNLRVNAATGKLDLNDVVRQSDALQERMWVRTAEAGREDKGSITIGLFVQSLNEMIDLQMKRLTVAVRTRIPFMVWATLYVIICVAMIMMGTQIGQNDARQFTIELALAFSFSVVLFLIVDLDRLRGLVTVNEQAMVDVQTTLNTRSALLERTVR